MKAVILQKDDQMQLLIMKANRDYLTFAACLAATLTGFGQSGDPGLPEQPVSQWPYVGGNIVFSVIATGAPPPSYQWRFRGIDLPGKTNSSLSILHAQFTNAGPYSVVVSNDSGVVTSQTAWLSVLPTNVVNLGDRELRFGQLSVPIWEAARSNDEPPFVTGDGLTLFYGSEAGGGSGGLDIWMVTRPTLSSPWGTPVNLGPTVNSSANDSGPRLSRDGLSLYFHSNRSDGLGGVDIWVATRPGLDAPFSAPVNLGPSINSSGDDDIPIISADNRTLVFDSSRSGGPGENDIWMSTRTNAAAPWEPARLLPAPINHSGDTFAVELSPDGLLLFLKSWRPISDPPGANPVCGLYVCRRSSQDQPFGAPVLIRPILGIGTGGVDFSSLSDDGATLYLGTYRNLYPDWPQLRQIDVTLLPQLSIPKGTAPGQFQLELLGREGANYEIQVSPDLSTWTPWLTTNTASKVQLSDPIPAPEGRRFYRALSH
jgi:hypothetical protein